MPRAILIAGNARRFCDEVEDLRHYLVREAGIRKRNVHESRAAYLSRSVLEMHLTRAVMQRTKEPLLVLYSGHGGPDGWALDDVRTFDYRRLAGVLRTARRPVIVLNDCCHAMAMVKAFEAEGLRADRRAVIAASEEGETTTFGLVRWVTQGWRQRRPVRFGPELRWGANLDRFFYPPVAATPASTAADPP
jgi:hypothetical protein